MTRLKLLQPATEAQKTTRTTLDTVEVTRETVKGWKNPPFQRPLQVNLRVRRLSDQIKEGGGVIPGTVTLGVIGGDVYLIDGQHRREAFLLSDCSVGYVDVRTHFFSGMAEMSEEFVHLNTQLVRLRADDVMRGLEESHEPLRHLHAHCPFVGYDMVRRGKGSPVLSMAVALRVWQSPGVGSSLNSGGQSNTRLGLSVTMEDAEALGRFLTLCHEAWGRDAEYGRLWGALNLALCAWFYRNVKMPAAHFRKCLIALSADPRYVEWLHGRLLRVRDRGPAFERVRAIFARRLKEETGTAPRFPRPSWD